MSLWLYLVRCHLIISFVFTYYIAAAIFLYHTHVKIVHSLSNRILYQNSALSPRHTVHG